MKVNTAIRSAYGIRLVDHIKSVREAGEKIGVDRTLLEMHDESKWCEEEFDAYALYFCSGEDKSPADSAHVSNAFAKAWLHHIHHNPHHWQHWIFSDGFSPEGSGVENGVMQMPENFAREMIADWMGASKVYTGSLDMTNWLVNNIGKIRVHSKTAEYLESVLGGLGYCQLFEFYEFGKELT